MFQDLPKWVQQEVQYHLDNHDHASAKLVHDQWMMKNHHKITERDNPNPLKQPDKLAELL